MIAATVFNQLIDTLNGNPTLSEYVKKVFKGIRYNINPEHLPCIMCEIRGNNEIDKNMGQIKDIFLDIDVVAFVSSPDNPDYAIVGDKELDYIGVLDIENDIRACLQSSYTLADYVLDVRFEPTEFLDFEYKNVLARGVRVPIRILYRQTDGI